MGETIRFGVSMDSDLVALLDQLTERSHHDSRSETIRDLVRREIIETTITDETSQVLGTLTVLFNQKTQLPRAPVSEYPSIRIIANLQFHIESEICQKVIIVRGTAGEVQAWAQRVLSSSRVFGKLTYSATEELFKELENQNTD
ncbi:MAG: ribbon-helix-helix protein, CopG family [Sphaerochaeta sp.]|jgi:CopG family nickel-responsive transcriptional regulator|nr:ribbon-helix-helix protein, CopG family [Spirochaetales bacterium]